MSSGYIEVQESGDHQCVIFTLVGAISEEQRDYWNQAVANMKAKLPKVSGITLVGPRCAKHLPKPGPLAAP